MTSKSQFRSTKDALGIYNSKFKRAKLENDNLDIFFSPEYEDTDDFT